jgi:hypothetical protein
VGCGGIEGDFSEGVAVWRPRTLSGYIDHFGKVVIEPRFDSAGPFSEGLAAVQVSGKWGYIDKTGKMVIAPMTMESMEGVHHGLSFVRTPDGRYGYID